MKKLGSVACALALLTVGCASKTGTGALAGGAIGAGTGALIGGGQGALIGGAVGVAAGAVVGASLDAQDRESMQQKSPETLHKLDNQEQLSIQDIKNMSKNGLSDEVIISQIKATHSTFELTSDEIIDLKESGVSEKVINYMIRTGK